MSIWLLLALSLLVLGGSLAHKSRADSRLAGNIGCVLAGLLILFFVFLFGIGTMATS
jgi:hypothetical protein